MFSFEKQALCTCPRPPFVTVFHTSGSVTEHKQKPGVPAAFYHAYRRYFRSRSDALIQCIGAFKHWHMAGTVILIFYMVNW